MKLGLASFLTGIVISSSLAACGGSTNGAGPTPDAGTTDTDAGTPGDDGGSGDDGGMPEAAPPVDHGMPSTTYPAFKPDMPQLQKGGGTIYSAPVIVTVTWETDPNVTQLEAFDDGIGASDFWKAAVSEYGVGPSTNGGHVHIPVNAANPLPAKLTTDQIEALIDQGVANGWPTPTAQTIYAVYPPSAMQVTTDDGTGTQVDACTVFYGYHSQTAQSALTYALSLPCAGGGLNALDTLTSTGAHELGEAATDPGQGGYFGFDTDHIAWSMFQQGQLENGDVCEFYNDANYKASAPFAFELQRLWSNAAASAGHNPCVPAAPGPYFGAAPTAPETVSYTRRTTTVMTKGFHIPVGTSKTFPVGLFSDSSTNGDFTLRVAEAFTPNASPPSKHNLTISIDKTSGQNGEIAYVTVKANAAGQTIGGRVYASANFITILASKDGATHYTPVLITTN
jgi:hypothetical protein